MWIATYRLAEPGVRAHHATIERRLDGYYLRGLDSPNGVYVNGQAITEQRLSSGDELEIGPVHLRFEFMHDGGGQAATPSHRSVAGPGGRRRRSP